MSNNVVEYQRQLAQKLAAKYNAVGVTALKAEDIGEANTIFKELLKTAEVQVRSVLAMNLSHNDNLPSEIAMMMAKDVSLVSNPVLEHSNVLSDQELLEIIEQETNAAKLQAIARRMIVSETVSDALVETKIESVVKTVVKNEGAQISENTFYKIADRHSESEDLMGTLLQRQSVPVAVVEKVIERVSETMRASLEKKYGNLDSFKSLKNTLEQSIEVISLKMLGFESTDEELMRVLNHLDGSNKMTPFSALTMPSRMLFEISLSRLLNIPLKNVQILLQDKNAFKQIYEKAELPEFLYEAAALAFQAMVEIEALHKQQFRPKDMITPAEVMSRMRELAGNTEVEGIDYLYALLQQSIRKNMTGAAATN